jgi:hypothetical protein
MKYTFSMLLLFGSLFFMFSCSKNYGGTTTTPTPTPEPQLAFTINPDPGTSILAALGASQDIAASITSTMPSAGVTADVTVVKELDNSSVFSQTLSSTTPNFTVSIQNLTAGTVCTATITLTSKSTLSNKASKTFKIARK